MHSCTLILRLLWLFSCFIIGNIKERRFPFGLATAKERADVIVFSNEDLNYHTFK